MAVNAQVTPPEEYHKTVQSAEVVGTLGPELFGDATSLYTGATTFTATDVTLPGNNALPVSIGRRFLVQSRAASERNALLTRDGGFADWELDIPHLRGVFAQNKGWQVDSWSESGKNLRCSLAEANQAEPPTVPGSMSGFLEGFQYWSGNTLYVPGVGDQEMLVANAATNPHRPTDGRQYRWVTNNQWYVSCLPATANGVPGDAFLAVDPAGTRYHFDWFAKRHASTLLANGTSLGREEVWILPTKVEDRFGNVVTYTYDPARPWHLTSIEASDGRRLTITYSGNWIASVSDGTRTWRYGYGNGLTEVILPDQSKWTIDFAHLRNAYTLPGNAATARCSEQTANPNQTLYTGTIVHPSGAVGEFHFRSQMHGRSYVTKSCPGTPSTQEGFVSLNPFYFEVVGITSKKITGLGLAPMQWTYVFGPANRSWAESCPDNSCPSTKTLEVSGPGVYHRYTFGNRWRHSEGKLLLTETGSSATDILRTEASTYQLDPSGQAYPAVIGHAAFVRGDGSSTKHTPLIRRTVTQQGSTFEWRAETFDAYARPLRTTRASSLGHARTDATAYADNTTHWVLGQVASSTNLDTHLVESRTEFDALARPIRTYAFGQLQQTLTYHPDGTLASASNAYDTPDFDTTVTYADYRCGIAQTIRHPATPEAPAGAVQRAVVNDDGTLASVTDAHGHKTCYDYDAMGRLSKITYPSGTQHGVCDASASTPTTIAFAGGYATAYGMPAGHWRQTTHTGNARHVTIFDALRRPVVEQTIDFADVDGTMREVVRRYDAHGRLVFESDPMNTGGAAHYADAGLQGTQTTYDPLGRVTRVQQDSELGRLTTTTEYLSGGRTRTTDPRGNATTTTYQMFDAPDFASPILIEHPEDVRTEIVRDVFGAPASMTRSGPAQ